METRLKKNWQRFPQTDSGFHPPVAWATHWVFTAKKQKGPMAKRTDTKIAVLIQVMNELGFDRETIAKVSRVPQRTVSDIIYGKGCRISWSEAFTDFR